MAIVSCPECGKKLKVADTSVGKKVKCTAGHIFVAQTDGDGGSAPSPSGRSAGGEGAPEKVVVACTECSAKLKVATTSLGKKMKCPKCTGIFVAAIEDESPRPVKKAPPVLAVADDDEEEVKPRPKAKAKPPGSDDDDDLFNMAQEDVAARPASTEYEDDEPPPMPKSKKKKFDDDDEEDEPKPAKKAKRKIDDDDEEDSPRAKAKASKPARATPDTGEKPVYPSRMLPNILVAFLLLIFVGLFGAVFFGVNLASLVGLREAKGAKKKTPIIIPDNKDKDSKDKDKPATGLDGVWIVETAEEKGRPKSDAPGDRFTFTAGKFKGPDRMEGDYTIDEAKDPKWLDMILEVPVPQKGAPPTKQKLTFTGIHKIDGDKLHWAFVPPDGQAQPGPRPVTFESNAGVYVVLRRATKEELDAPAFSHRMSQINLKQMGLAVHFFADINRLSFPASAIHDATGKPLLSWRVAILPFVEQEALYREFDLTKPWDDPHNKKLIAKMPSIYVVPGTDGKDGKTHYRALVGRGTVLEPPQKPSGPFSANKINTLKDGTSNCIMIVEAKEPIEWTRPDDLPYDDNAPLPPFGVAPGGFNVLFADARTQLVPYDVPERILRPYLTCQNGLLRQPLDGKPSPKPKDIDKDKDFKNIGKGKDSKIFDKDKDFKKFDKEKAFKDVNNGKDEAKVNAAKVQARTISAAAQAYALLNGGKFPATLDDLLRKDPQGGGPYLQNQAALMDPWGRAFQYDPSGPRNQGVRADIWTVTPDKQIIGNWPAK